MTKIYQNRLCRHCCRQGTNRPRGLCWSCYYTPGLRERYAIISKHGRRGVGLSNDRRPLPAEPTASRPGTPEKVAVLEARAAQDVSLWHPLDAQTGEYA